MSHRFYEGMSADDFIRELNELERETTEIEDGTITGPRGPRGPRGGPGLDGDMGDACIDGNVIATGNGVPDDANNVDGDLYVRRDVNELYLKVSGSWALQ